LVDELGLGLRLKQCYGILDQSKDTGSLPLASIIEFINQRIIIQLCVHAAQNSFRISIFDSQYPTAPELDISLFFHAARGSLIAS
jgi:hypothetical protein